MNQYPQKNRNNQTYQENRKLSAKLFDFSFPDIPYKINEFGFQVVVVSKPMSYLFSMV